MQTTRMAAVSMNGFLGEPDRVLKSMAGWCERAATEKADLVLFPELVIHGHCTPNTWDLAETVPGGPSVQRLEQLAKQFRLTLCVGLSEKERDIVYNTQVVVGPGGYLGKQRKLHLSRDEVLFYKGGREITVFDVGKCKIGIVICYDNQFPEIARVLALRGADVILMPHAARIKMWDDTPESAGRRPAATRTITSRATACGHGRTPASPCWPIRRAAPATSMRCPATSPAQPHHAGSGAGLRPRRRAAGHDPGQADTRRDDCRHAGGRGAGPPAIAAQLHAPHAAPGAVCRAGARPGVELMSRVGIWQNMLSCGPPA